MDGAMRHGRFARFFFGWATECTIYTIYLLMYMGRPLTTLLISYTIGHDVYRNKATYRRPRHSPPRETNRHRHRDRQEHRRAGTLPGARS